MINMNLSYLLPALLGGIGVVLVAGPLGTLMVWRRLAYFSDTVSHAALLGVTLALVLNMDITVGIAAIALLVSLLLFVLQQRFKVASDTLLGILSHTFLALGLLALSFFQNIRVDVLGFLYGDILAINNQDVMCIAVGVVITYGVLYRVWQPMLRVILDKELAQVEGVSVGRVALIYNLLTALIIALSIKLIGVLLMTALLLIPPTCARVWSKSPEQMIVLATIIGLISFVIGLGLSHQYDVPAGPMIVVISAIMMILSRLFKTRRSD